MRVEIGESTINLVVVRHTAAAEGLDDAVETHLYRRTIEGKSGSRSERRVDEE